MASPVPVLPEVGSMIVPPGRRRPSRSAASMSFRATRSLIEPPGLNDSSFATICGARPCPIRLRRMSGVLPTVSRIDSLMSWAVPLAVMEATIGRAPPAEENGGNCEGFPIGAGARPSALLLNAQEVEASARRVEEMVMRHGPALLRVANQFSLCHDDALDAYQRALEIYLRRLETVDPATEGAWMRVVVKHEAMAIARARQESVAREDLDLDASAAGLRDVAEQVAGGERVDRSVEALRALKPDEAKALMLKAQGLSYQEIGRRFGWTYTKVNRSITEGRRRFMDVFRGIEDGEACERHAGALAALAAGTATSAELVALRPHLRHCAACRATMRELRVSRRRRIAALVPGLPWLLRRFGHTVARVPADVQYAAATGGGGRVGPAVAVLGVCLGGAGAAVCAAGGTLPLAPPLIAHAAQPRPPATTTAAPRHPPAPRPTPLPALAGAAPATPTGAFPRHTRVRAIAVAATATPTVSLPRPTATATPARRVVHDTSLHHVHHSAARHEFGFEGAAPAATATPAPVVASAASVGATTTTTTA